MTPTPPKRRCGGTNNNYLLQRSAALSGLRRMVYRSVTELSVQGSRLLGVQAEEASMCLGQRDDRKDPETGIPHWFCATRAQPAGTQHSAVPRPLRPQLACPSGNCKLSFHSATFHDTNGNLTSGKTRFPYRSPVIGPGLSMMEA